MKKYAGLNDLGRILESNNAPVALFGAGSLGKLALYALRALGVRVDFFCDNDRQKQGNFYCGVEVISAEELSESNLDSHIFVCSDYVASVFTQLKHMNFTNIYDCTGLLKNTDFSSMGLDMTEEKDPNFSHNPLDIGRIIGLHEMALKNYDVDSSALGIKYIDIVITERCSMKCRDCSNLMQYYASPKHSDLDVLLGSIGRLMKCVDHVYEVRVLGGEPFLNSEIHKIINDLVAYKKVDNVVIYTNATIIPRNENLLCLKNDKVKLDISNYGSLSRNHHKLVDALRINGIKYATHIITAWTDSGRVRYRYRTEKELISVFMNCCVGDVLTLLNGKLYCCPFSANAHNLNAIPFKEEDVIDLHYENKDLSVLKNEIRLLYTRRDRKQYPSACVYCNGRDYNTSKIKPAVQIRKPLTLDDSSSAGIMTNRTNKG